MKKLEVGKDYAFCFGFEAEDKSITLGLIYNGGDSWSGTENGVTIDTHDDADITTAALEYINRPTVSIGSPK